MLPTKGGHVWLRRHSDDGNSLRSLTTGGNSARRARLVAQVHAWDESVALVADGSTSIVDNHRGSEQQFSKRPTSRMRLLSAISLILILMLSRQCSARVYPAMTDDTSLGINQPADSFVVDRQQQQLVDVGYALEMGCRNLVEAMLHPQRVQPKDQRAALDFMEFVDSERNKRLSPKHTPRFGR